MKSTLLPIIIGAMAASTTMPTRAITIDDDSSALIYCVSTLSGNRGVYTIPSSGEFSATKLTGATYIQYDFGDSGGTFVSKDKVYGTKDAGYSVFAGSATAEGDENGPWSHTYWNYRGANGSYNYEIVATDMTFDPVEEKIYGWFKADKDGTAYRLAVYDGDNITVSPIGPNSKVELSVIAADAAGELWGIEGRTGDLYKINKTTGIPEKTGTLPVHSGEKGQSAAFDPSTGKLYWGAVMNAMTATLYKVDVNTLATESIYDFPIGQRFNAFYIPAKEAKKGAPAKVEDLAGRFTGENSEVEVTFTAPTTSFGGQAISGDLKYELALDNEPLDKGTVATGAQFAKAYQMTEGSHSLSLTLANNAGNGPKATATVYVGFDTPGAVKNLQAAQPDNSTVVLAWETPEGELGGLIDPTKITYDVVRFPDFEQVATGLTGTTFTDEIADALIAEYSYSVATVYDGKETASTSTELLLVGHPHSIPFSENFDGASTLSEITCKVIDLDPNTPTWTLAEAEGNKYIETRGENNTQRRDYFFTAPISFKAATEYTLRFKISNDSPGTTTQLRIFLSKSRSTNDADFVKPYIKANFNHQPTEPNAGKFIEQEMKFTLEEGGDYSLAFYDFSSYWVNNAIGIDDIEITESNSALQETSLPSALQASAGKDRISIAGTPGSTVSVFSANGIKVFTATIGATPLTTGQLQPGLYIVTDGTSTTKAIIK